MKKFPRSIVLIFGTILTFSLSSAMTVILIPFIADSLDFSATLFGLLVAVPGAVTILFEIPLAAWSDRVGRKPILLLGVLVGILGTSLLAWRVDTAFLILFTTMNALSVVLFFPSILAYLSEVASEDEHPHLQGVNGFVQGIAFTAGAWLAGQLITGFSIRVALVALALVYGICFLLTAFAREMPRAGEGKRLDFGEIWQAYKTVFRMVFDRSQIQLAALIEVLASVLVVVLGNAFFPLYITSQALGSAAFAGGLVSVRNLSSTVTSLFFGRTTKRLGMLRPLFSMLTLTALTFFFLPRDGNNVVWIGVLLLQGAGVGFIPAAPNVLIAEGTKTDERATGYASVTFISRTMQLIFPPIFGLLADWLGLQMIFPIGAGIALVLILVGVLKTNAFSIKRRM